MSNELLFALLSSVVAIIYGVVLIKWILKLPKGNDKMQAIANAIQEGARAYLIRQYKTIGIIAAVVFILLGIFS